MFIKEMFCEDIDRKINGVIKVDQKDEEVIDQEVREYVITNELKKHFDLFFNDYTSSFDEPTADIGVWVSGFFGSGKSHFLKMLSYILENRELNGVKIVERFREKFGNDHETFQKICKATSSKTETILFNIDIESSIKKDDTAVLRVLAKVFYNHLGFYGEDLKVAMLEKYVAEQGKTEVFRKVFEQYKGKPWIEQRKAYAFNGKAIVATLVDVLDMRVEDAQAWLKDNSVVNYSIAQLVSDIKTYVDSKPENFRLLFMIDEVGQYIGDNRSLLLNLQSVVEKLGSECLGRVWVMCTGQEAIDEIIKVRTDEFSRIQARFKMRLSLTSSSVDEVIQKRILKKNDMAANKLMALYHNHGSILRNLFTFNGATLDIKGFDSAEIFYTDFPFVPYQFIIMQKVFAEIRKHGNAGKHFSGGERSMLSGFHEAAQALCRANKDEYALAPFYLFYDTVHTFLDGTIRRVIERCQNAANSGVGIEEYDVYVLKLLYLIRYVDDIRSSLDNIIILMADDIRTDTLSLRERIQKSLDRLLGQNYIGYSGGCYKFLTDDEQEIQREIKNTVVDTSSIVERISQLIYGDIYQSKKYRYRNKYDFDFDKRVDDMGAISENNMTLRFLTDATDKLQKTDIRLMGESKKQAIVVLDEAYGYACYEALERALKIRKYIKQRNIQQLPKTIQDIIKFLQDDIGGYELKAVEALKKAIEHARFFVDGECLVIKGGDAKAKIDMALEYLVEHVYSELNLIDTNIDDEKKITDILAGKIQHHLDGNVPNAAAASKVSEYLEMQFLKKLPTSMGDIQARYQGIPYGWREIDIAAVVAQLIYAQKATVKYAGQVVKSDNKDLVNYLRKKAEVSKTKIEKRQTMTVANMRQVKSFLREYFDIMDIPEDEEHLVNFVITRFEKQESHYGELLQRYARHSSYPDFELVKKSMCLVSKILEQKNDNIALIDAILDIEDELFESKEDMQNVEAFFKNQVHVFDAALALIDKLHDERDYLYRVDDIRKSFEQIQKITEKQINFNYRRIPELHTLMRTITDLHNQMLLKKREELNALIAQCMKSVHEMSMEHASVKKIRDEADEFYTEKKNRVLRLENLALLDGLKPLIIDQKDVFDERITEILHSEAAVEPDQKLQEAQKDKVLFVAPGARYCLCARQVFFPSVKIETPEDVENYVELIHKKLLLQLKKGAFELK